MPPAMDARGRRPVHPSRSARQWVLLLSLWTGALRLAIYRALLAIK